MEVYEDMENDAPDAPGAPNATTNIEGQENETGRKGQGIRQIAVGNRSGNAGVLKAAGGGKGKIETRQSAKDQPASITALKLIAKQGANEKAQPEQWKEDLVVKITCEMTQLRKAQEETMQAQYREMENQRVFYTLEIEALKEEIKELKRSEGENIFFPSCFMSMGTPATGKNQAQPTKERKSLENSAEPIEEEICPIPNAGNKDNTPVPHISLAKNTPNRNYASVAASIPAQAPEHPWTKVVYKKRKINAQKSAKPIANIEHQGRRILFPREASGQQMSEADLMLALNEALCCTRPVDDPYPWMGGHIPWMVAVTGGSCYPSRGRKSIKIHEWGGPKN